MGSTYLSLNPEFFSSFSLKSPAETLVDGEMIKNAWTFYVYILVSNFFETIHRLQETTKCWTLPGEGGTPIHYLYGYAPPNGVVILKFLISNGASILEAFSRTGYNISNARKLQFCKQPFEIIQGQIAFKNTVQCVNKQTVVLLLHPVF